MAANLEEIRATALKLPADDKLALADELYASVGPDQSDDARPLSAAWKREIDRRLEDARAGRTHWLTEEEFFASLDVALASVRK